MNDPSEDLEVIDYINKFIESQIELDPEIYKLIDDNFWQLLHEENDWCNQWRSLRFIIDYWNSFNLN